MYTKNSELSTLFEDTKDLLSQDYHSLGVLFLSKVFDKSITKSEMIISTKYCLSYHLPVENYIAVRIFNVFAANRNRGLILLDLMKAFDCLSKRLLFYKQRASGWLISSCKRNRAYMCNRLQRVNMATTIGPLQWRHNGRDNVSNHQPHDCLPIRLFRRKSKKTAKLRVTGLCAGNSPVIGEFPA